MPGMNGYEVAKEMRARMPHSVVLIAHSGDLMIRQRDMGEAKVFDLCFSKGMDVTDLRQRLDDLLKSRSKSSAGPGSLGGREGASTARPRPG